MTFREAEHNLDSGNAVQIGKILKPHGYKGHLTVSLKFDSEQLHEESVLVRINGWLVPFFIDYEQSNLYALKPIIKFQEVNDEDSAEALAHKPILLPRHLAEKYIDIYDFDNLEGYTIKDQTSGKSGVITAYEDLPKNPLIKVRTGNQDTLIPVNAITVLDINEKNKTISVQLPEGLL